MLDLKALAQKVLDNLKSPVVVETFTIPSQSYAANTVKWHYNDNRVPSKTGYTAIGIVGSAQNSGSLVSNLQMLDGRIAGYTWNRTSTAVTIAVSADILFIRNDLL